MTGNFAPMGRILGQPQRATQQRYDRIVELTAQGVSDEKIMWEVGCCRRTLQRAREARNARLRSPAIPWTPEERARAVEHLEDGASLRDAARSVGRGTGGAHWLGCHVTGYAWTREQIAEYAALSRKFDAIVVV